LIVLIIAPVLSPLDSSLSSACFRLLSNLFASATSISFLMIKMALQQLGALSSALNTVGLKIDGKATHMVHDPDRKAILVYRLVALIAAAAR